MGTVKWTSIPDDRPPHGWNLDFLTLPEKKFILDSLEFFVKTIKGADLRNKGITARKHVLDDRDYTKSDIVVIVLSLGWLKNYVGANVSFEEGEEVEAITRLPELAETIKEKIKEEYEAVTGR